MTDPASKKQTKIVSAEDWSRAKGALTVAAALEPGDRTRLLETCFPNDPALRVELLAMLQVHDRLKNALTPERLAALSTSATPGPAMKPASEVAETVQIGDVYGPYRVVRLIGAGGMGQVFLAEDTRLRRRVALKSLAGPWMESPTARQRLLREARTAAALSHPHIATLFDILEDERQLLLVMEYVEGRTAAALVADGPMPVGHALRLTIQVCEALVYAHDRGIIHCDIKPSNVQVSPDGAAKVLDFGLAHAKSELYDFDEESSDREALLIGTPPYMPPERLVNGALTASGDIYSLGVTLFELITARLPFEEPDFVTLIGAIIARPAPTVSSRIPEIPAYLDEVVARAMAKDPRERYQTAREFSRDLEHALRALDGDTVVTPVASGSVRRQARTESRILTAGLATLAAAIGLTVIGFLTSTMYGSPLGLTMSFEGESPLSWPVWGLRALILPLGQIVIVLLVVAVAIQLWRTALAIFAPLRRWSDYIFSPDGKIMAWARRIPIRALAGSLLVAHVLALVLFAWGFREVYESIDNLLLKSGSLAALNPAYAADHQWYMRVLSLMTLGFGWAWYRLLKTKPSLYRVSAPTLTAGTAMMVISVLLMTAPYRLFFQSKGERVEYASRTCYLVGKNGNQAMLFCPTQEPPWTRLVNLNDPALIHSGVLERIFSAGARK